MTASAFVTRVFWSFLSLALIAGCNGATPPLASNQGQAPMQAVLGDGKTSCSVKVKLNPAGGFLNLPKCAGFSGRMKYPTAATNGTITANITVSLKNPGLYEAVPDAIYYMTWIFTSSSSSDTEVPFQGTSISPTDGSHVTGPLVDASSHYYFDFEVPNVYHPVKKTKVGISVSATTKGHKLLGVPFVGTTVLVGDKNFVVISTNQN